MPRTISQFQKEFFIFSYLMTIKGSIYLSICIGSHRPAEEGLHSFVKKFVGVVQSPEGAENDSEITTALTVLFL